MSVVHRPMQLPMTSLQPADVPRLLGGHLTYSARDLSEATGTPIDRVVQFWIALGFQAPDPDEPVFSQRDLDVFGKWHDLVESGAIDTATSRSLLRANSHLADRLGPVAVRGPG